MSWSIFPGSSTGSVMNGVPGTQGRWNRGIWRTSWSSSDRDSFPWQEAEGMEEKKTERRKVICPYCGRPVNAMRDADASCKGIFFRCKEKDCRKVFELRI